MSRPQVYIRRVDSVLEPQLIDLWVANRVEAGSSPDATQRIAADGTLSSSLARPEVTAFVALADGTAVGYLVLSDTTSGVFVDAYGYSTFFIGTAVLGVPVLVLVALASRASATKSS